MLGPHIGTCKELFEERQAREGKRASERGVLGVTMHHGQRVCIFNGQAIVRAATHILDLEQENIFYSMVREHILYTPFQ